MCTYVRYAPLQAMCVHVVLSQAMCVHAGLSQAMCVHVVLSQSLNWVLGVGWGCFMLSSLRFAVLLALHLVTFLILFMSLFL